MKKINLNLYIYLGIILLALMAGWYLVLPGYFFMHDDLQVMRFHQLEKCFLDGQIPCRWVPDMGAGYGFPLYNFYSPLPYYAGMIFRWPGMFFMATAKLTFLSAYLVSGIAMYWLVNQVTKSRLAAFLSATFYLWAPYRASQIFVRGALAESFALAFFPLVLGLTWKWAHESKLKFSPWLILGLSGLYLSHNIMAMWFTPVLLAFALVSLIHAQKINFKSTLYFSISFLWAIALAGFFIIPALLEQSLVRTQTLTQDYFDFRLHFSSLSQLFFDRQWGYGPSRPGPVDDMSFQIGIWHWLVGLLSTFGLTYQIIKKRITWHRVLPWSFFNFMFFIFTYLMHSKSVWLWELFPILAVTQFPWRLLSFVNLSSAILAGLFVNSINHKKTQITLTTSLILVVVLSNWTYFKPSQYDPSATDEQKLVSQWDEQRNGAIRDFTPATVSQYDDIPLSTQDVTISTTPDAPAAATNLMIRSDYFSLDVEVGGEQPAVVTVPIFNFPEWEVVVSDQPIAVHNDNDLGLISFSVPPGKHIITGWFRNTPTRVLANSLSLVALAALLFTLVLSSPESPNLTKKDKKKFAKK